MKANSQKIKHSNTAGEDMGEAAAAEASPLSHEAPGDQDEIVQRVADMVKMLRESMRALGLDKEIEKAAQAIPDARDRLSYIGSMTEQAAERSLNAIDKAQPLQDELAEGAKNLRERWRHWFDDPVELEQAKELVKDTRDYLELVPRNTDSTNKELLEIMMAQDFQDLTGQVVKKMMDVIRSLEFQLLQVVLDSVPEDDGRQELQKRVDELKGAEEKRGVNFLNGPQIDPGAADVMDSQDQVDDLLADLGF